MTRIVPVNAKGTRDFLPRDLVRRNRVFGLLRDTFERYGYEPLETPALYWNGPVAERRLQKCLGSENGWPISSEPTSLSPCMIRLPLAW